MVNTQDWPRRALVVGWLGVDFFHEAGTCRQEVGGKAMNQAWVMAMSGIQTTLLAAIGTDENAAFVRQRLVDIQRQLAYLPPVDLDTSHVQVRSGTTPIVELYMDNNSEPKIAVSPGVSSQISWQT